MRSANPALRDNVFIEEAHKAGAGSGVMTISGAVNKTAILLLLTASTFIYAWDKMMSMMRSPLGLQTTDAATSVSGLYPWMIGGVIVTFVIGLAITFKKTWAPYLSPVYALIEGGILGIISVFFELKFPGIVFQAVGLTFSILFCLLFAYKTKIIRATENFKLGIFAATAGIGLVYLVGFVLSFFGKSIPYIHESGVIGIGFSLFVVVIAALNLVLDFDFIENGEKIRAPKYMEWYSAFGLLVTLVWLYIEILHLLSKLRSRD